VDPISLFCRFTKLVIGPICNYLRQPGQLSHYSDWATDKWHSSLPLRAIVSLFCESV